MNEKEKEMEPVPKLVQGYGQMVYEYFCPRCGHGAWEAKPYCPYCGQKIKKI